jgi:hypothetical protein
LPSHFTRLSRKTSKATRSSVREESEIKRETDVLCMPMIHNLSKRRRDTRVETGVRQEEEAGSKCLEMRQRYVEEEEEGEEEEEEEETSHPSIIRA